jgi:hypothetical protein
LQTLNRMEIGNGQATQDGQRYICTVPGHDRQKYHNAQWDDYSVTKPPQFRWCAPLELSLTAWASHGIDQLQGTAGFGFWNHPFMPGGGLPRVPRAVWFFFASPPSNMALARGVPGRGWKAATFDAVNPLFFSLLPLSPIGILLMRIPRFYQRFWGVGQRALKVSEAMLNVDLAIPHEYRLRWEPQQVTFWVDGQMIHQTPYSPKGHLGFVAWLDNQYAIVTPQGKFGFGLLERAEAQSLTLENMVIRSLE